MTVVRVAVGAPKFQFGMCTVDRNVCTGYCSLVPRILHVCGHVHVRSHVSPDMDWTTDFCRALAVFIGHYRFYRALAVLLGFSNFIVH